MALELGVVGENDARASQLVQLLGSANRLTIYLVMRGKFFRERGIFRAASDSRYAIAKFVRELDAEMAKPADTLHSDEIAGTGSAVTKRIKSRNSGT
jgi:hypothetical protein